MMYAIIMYIGPSNRYVICIQNGACMQSQIGSPKYMEVVKFLIFNTWYAIVSTDSNKIQ